jgi:hypothetical protein
MGKKTTKQKVQKNKSKHVLGWPEWTLIGIVICSTLLIVLALCTGFFKTPQEKAEAELEKIANAYYVEYLYPRILGNLDSDPKKVLEVYNEIGVPTTYLRQLLHYNNDEYASSAKYFERLGCDTNNTGAKFFPTEPYGPRDYTVSYTWQCEEGDFPK